MLRSERIMAAKPPLEVVWQHGMWLLTILVIGMTCCRAIGATAAGDDETSRDETLVLGRVSGEPGKHYAAIDALGEYLVTRLKASGIKRHDVLLARNNDEMIQFLRSGKIDVVSETPFSAVLYETAANAEIVLRQWKSGTPSYRTLLVARHDSEIERIEDLAGKVIAFEDPGSTSSYFVPKATIAELGMGIVSADDPAENGAVQYLFAGSEVNVLAWVVRGRADAGAVSSVDWADPKRSPVGLKDELRVFHSSPDILRSVIIVRPRMDPELKQQLVQTLVDMRSTESGREALAAFFKTTQFDMIEGDTLESLDNVRNLFDELRFSEF